MPINWRRGGMVDRIVGQRWDGGGREVSFAASFLLSALGFSSFKLHSDNNYAVHLSTTTFTQ
ncbi:hypothetical protein N7456_009144 [Penicillium angulare]|uniref:Uncharacterized protein n=1 Tax=Penicillium angulare TaxID=116970 RepID=A0A9W9K4X7_9EURO|nr:hypothetical protein N7456_009144 [Penicillium angulare]